MNDIVLLDGGMGQALLHRSGRAPSPLWSAAVLEEQPELVRELHVEFIRAGARVITLNAYSATPERLARHGKERHFASLQASAIRLAREAIEEAATNPVSIAGCLPPLNASYRPDVAPGSVEMRELYGRIVSCQQNGVDVFLCETMGSVLEARVAAECALASGKPVWVAMTIRDDDTGHLRSGETLADAMTVLESLPIDAILLNCSTPESIERAWPVLSQSGKPIGTYPNAFKGVGALKPGGTVDVLEARDDMGSDRYARWCVERVRQGARIIGGCCEIGPDCIAAVHDALNDEGYRIGQELAADFGHGKPS